MNDNMPLAGKILAKQEIEDKIRKMEEEEKGKIGILVLSLVVAAIALVLWYCYF